MVLLAKMSVDQSDEPPTNLYSKKVYSSKPSEESEVLKESKLVPKIVFEKYDKSYQNAMLEFEQKLCEFCERIFNINDLPDSVVLKIIDLVEDFYSKYLVTKEYWTEFSYVFIFIRVVLDFVIVPFTLTEF